MSQTVSVLEDRWRLLEEAGAPSSHDGVKTAGVGVTSADAELVAAIDADGFRHLLVPLRGEQRVRRVTDPGSVLNIRERPLDDGTVRRRYLDVGCLKAELNDAFTSVCADVVEAVRATPGQQIKATLTAIARWRELLKVVHPRLSPVQLAGLFGELTLLIRLLEVDPSATCCWTGPLGHRHDFTAGNRAIEAKVSTSGDATRVRIHGLDQLDPPPDGVLDLMWLHVERGENVGTCVPDLVAEARRLADDDALLTSRLEAAGYHVGESAVYREARFTVLDEHWYAVVDPFPRLTVTLLEGAGLGLPVSDVHYTVDLAGAAGCRLDAVTVAERVTTFTAELA